MMRELMDKSIMRPKFICGDALDVLRNFSDGYIDCEITSTPYGRRNWDGTYIR